MTTKDALDDINIVRDTLQANVEMLLEVGSCVEHLICNQLALKKIEKLRQALQEKQAVDLDKILEELAAMLLGNVNAPEQAIYRVARKFCEHLAKQGYLRTGCDGIFAPKEPTEEMLERLAKSY